MIDANLDDAGELAVVIGGSGGIGNALAQAIGQRRAGVEVTGAKAGPRDCTDGDGSDPHDRACRQPDVAAAAVNIPVGRIGCPDDMAGITH